MEKNGDTERGKFRNNYIGPIDTEFEDDFLMFRSLKRTVNSYCKNPDKHKFHSICNKIIILRRVFDDDFLFIEVLNLGDGDEYKLNFLKFLMNEVFSTRYRISEVDDLWEEHVLTCLSEKRIIKQPRKIVKAEAMFFLNHLNNIKLHI